MHRAVQLLSGIFVDCVPRLDAHQHSLPDSRPAYLEFPQEETQSATVVELDVVWYTNTLAKVELGRRDTFLPLFHQPEQEHYSQPCH
jgi:hypothetical protein